MTPAPVGLRCPEHSGKPQGVQRVTKGAQRAVTGVGSRRVNAVTMALIAINVAVYLVELGANGSWDGTGNWLFNHGVLVMNAAYAQGSIVPLPPHAPVPSELLVGVAHGEWWRMVTGAFLHYGPIHLAINMYSLYWVGTLLEQIIGRWRFVLLYLVSGVAGSAGALLLTPNAATVGASGAIFGVLGALYVLERARHLSSGGQIATLIVINLIFTFAFSGAGFSVGSSVTGITISVGGHLGGLVGGAALMWIFLRVRRSVVYSIGACAAVAVAAVLVAYWRTRGYV